MLPILCVVLLTVGGVLASPIANNYVDNLLAYTLKNQIAISKLDPVKLPDFNTGFEDKVVFVKVKGHVNYTDGTLTGLSNVVRFSECWGPSNVFGAVKINCTIGFNNLRTEYKGKLKYGKLPAVPVKAKANITTTILFVEFTRQFNAAQLTNLQFQFIGEVKPKFTGLGKAMNKYLSILENGYKVHVKSELMDTITNKFYHALNMAARQLPMPT